MNDHDLPESFPEIAVGAPSLPAPVAQGADPSVKPAGVKRIVASLLLAIGLMTAGGAAIANAASPDPSATPTPAASSSPSTTTPGSQGTNGANGGDHADCPNM
jgi:hypothetical protein